jgi:hypothetical protein
MSKIVNRHLAFPIFGEKNFSESIRSLRSIISVVKVQMDGTEFAAKKH